MLREHDPCKLLYNENLQQHDITLLVDKSSTQYGKT